MAIINIEKDILLSNLTTFKIGGKAKYFVCVKNLEEVREAVGFAEKNHLPFFVFGGGSNLLVSDDGFDGVIIKNEILGSEFFEKDNFVLTKIGAGESWDGFVDSCVRRGLWGVENLSGIPGTVGASSVQNIGAYGVEVKDTIFSVEVFDTKTGEVITLENKDCNFAYRDSFFKTQKGKSLIVLSVTFKLRKVGQPNLEYKDLTSYFSGSNDTPSLESIRRAVLEIRSKKFPDLKIFGTAGSFFKNPVVSKESYLDLLSKFPGLPGFESKDNFGVKISLAWLMDKVCNLKGFGEGGVALFEKQPIVVVNTGKATAKEVVNFVNSVEKLVLDKTGVSIAWEVEKL